MSYFYLIAGAAVGTVAYAYSYVYVPTIDPLTRAGIALGFAGLTATLMYFVQKK